MGVKGLVPQLEALYPGIFKHGLPVGCGVFIDEVMLRIHRYGISEEMTLQRLIQMACREYVSWFTSKKCKLLILTADSAEYVPKQKFVEQKKRNVERIKRAYPDNAQLVPVVEEKIILQEFTVIEGEGEVEKTTSTRVYMADPRGGGIEYDEAYIDPVSGVAKTHRLFKNLVNAEMLMSTSRMRRQFVEQIFLYIKQTIHAWPAHAMVLIDGGSNKHVQVVTPHMCEDMPDWSNVIGEGELKAVLWALRIRLMPEYKDSPILVKTRDADFVPALAIQLWDVYAEEETSSQTHSDIIFMHDQNRYVSTRTLFSAMRARGWSPMRFVCACALSETDYSSKSNTTHFIGLAVMWVAWDANQRKLEALIDSDLEEHPSETSLLRDTFECMVRVCYGQKFGVKSPCTISWDMIKRKSGSDKRLKPPSVTPYNRGFITGWAEYRWIWDYWGSMGLDISDIIHGRGEFNPQSEKIEELLLLGPEDLGCFAGDEDMDDIDRAGVSAAASVPVGVMRYPHTEAVSKPAAAAEKEREPDIDDAVFLDIESAPDPPPVPRRANVPSDFEEILSKLSSVDGHTEEKLISYLKTLAPSVYPARSRDCAAYLRYLTRHANGFAYAKNSARDLAIEELEDDEFSRPMAAVAAAAVKKKKATTKAAVVATAKKPSAEAKTMYSRDPTVSDPIRPRAVKPATPAEDQPWSTKQKKNKH